MQNVQMLGMLGKNQVEKFHCVISSVIKIYD